MKPYYSLISLDRETRDRHLEASIFEFLPHHVLEVINDRHAWVTLHIPKAARLGHPDNVREIREIRRRYPNIVLVIAHLGRCYTEPHALEALPQFADDPGLYFDSSAVLNPACHRVALQHLGPRRILYGSDNPVMYMRGRRQYRERTYINRTNHPFHFNHDREPPEVDMEPEAHQEPYIGRTPNLRARLERLLCSPHLNIRAACNSPAASVALSGGSPARSSSRCCFSLNSSKTNTARRPPTNL